MAQILVEDKPNYNTDISTFMIKKKSYEKY